MGPEYGGKKDTGICEPSSKLLVSPLITPIVVLLKATLHEQSMNCLLLLGSRKYRNLEHV